MKLGYLAISWLRSDDRLAWAIAHARDVHGPNRDDEALADNILGELEKTAQTEGALERVEIAERASDLLDALPVLLGTKPGSLAEAFIAVGRLAELVWPGQGVRVRE